VVDEFHHAAARTYRKLLNYFKPGFMLGLTATPERTDQADILSLCDDNLVYSRDLVDGIDAGLLSPFDYYGISDVVDYSKVRRTGGKFDSEQLFDEFRTKQRASHNFKHWQKHSQTRTLAFCVSKRHADDMASYFCSKKVKAIAVYSGSATRRSDALKQLSEGEVDIIFSVDLFNEGVDLPAIDTVLMLRPSDSKIIFLQQLGRGLRISPATGKNKLVVLDFIGNHVSFFRKAEALFKVGATSTARRNFLKKAVKKALPLPDGCTVKYDLVAIGFLKRYCTTKLSTQEDIYQALKDSLDRRPTLVEFYYATGEFKPLRRAYGQWFKFVELAGDLSLPEIECLQEHGEFFRAMEITSLEKCFKLILLEAMQELSGFEVPPTKLKLALQSWQILQRRPASRTDLSKEYLAGKELTVAQQPEWLKYWQTNPINAWVGKNLQSRNGFFDEQDELFFFKSKVTGTMLESFTVLLQELIDFRYAQYDDSKLTKSIKAAQVPTTVATNVADFPPREQISQSVPYFADLKIACGHFKLSEHDETAVKMMALPLSYGKLDPKKHFIACAKGHSMDGGKNPIKDGDYLLLEKVSPTSAGSMRNQIIAIELENTAGDDQYLLRKINKLGDGEYALIALNPDYESILTSGDMHPIGRFKRVVEFD
jgi:SOS-response transcriptional repressor LexA